MRYRFSNKRQFAKIKSPAAIIFTGAMFQGPSVFTKYARLYLAFLLLILAALITQLFNEKGEIVLWLHELRIAWLDEVFLSVTQLGELPGFLLAALMIVLTGTWRNLLHLGLATVLVLLAMYLLKYYVFKDAERPIAYFERLDLLTDFRPGYYLNRKHSFPSGHTAAGFAFFFTAAMATTRYGMQWVALLLAISVAFSRVYLMQHFVMDTVAGSILGVFLVSLTWKWSVRLYARKKSLDRQILRRGGQGT